MLNGKTYILCAIIEGVLPKDPTNAEHFKGHVLLCNKWYTHDSTQKNVAPAKRSDNMKIIPQLLVFLINNTIRCLLNFFIYIRLFF